MSASTWAERKEVLKIPSYFLYFVGTSISFLGMGMQFIANSWLVLEMTNANISVAILLICSSLPGIVLSPLSGVFIDRLDRRVLASSMDLFRAIVLLAIPIIYWAGFLEVIHLYFMAFFVAIGDLIFQPTVVALIREVVPKRLLMTANTTTQVTAQVGSLVGTGLGGLIVAFSSPIWVMVINAATFLVSAVCIINMRKTHRRRLTKDQTAKQAWLRYREDLLDGIRYIRNHRYIALLYILLLTFPLTLRLINVLLPSFTKEVLKVGADGFGYIDAAFATGAVIGGLYLSSVTQKWGKRFTMLFGMGALAGSLIIFSISTNLIVAIVGYLLIGITFQVRILYLTTIQHLVDLDFQGRVHSVFTTLVTFFSLGVYLLMGVLSEVVSQRWLYASQGIFILIVTLFSVVSLKTESPEEEASDAEQA
ncbi:MFS transporter [Paludifilum halophilum]|uniref:Major facilitator superfamily (MFS) profile domain-containing protein n=1 Tax=Paludifilum halophilum TaxID=1642702 RepID=A0A235B208_9BACL|nr:MFS transporter [Paludifilum halophilum]OYD06340.1 hypothetical protein CHM34_16630 [Paludifilum halophilum]